jgi:hypothetical protein
MAAAAPHPPAQDGTCIAPAAHLQNGAAALGSHESPARLGPDRLRPVSIGSVAGDADPDCELKQQRRYRKGRERRHGPRGRECGSAIGDRCCDDAAMCCVWTKPRRTAASSSPLPNGLLPPPHKSARRPPGGRDHCFKSKSELKKWMSVIGTCFVPGLDAPMRTIRDQTTADPDCPPSNDLRPIGGLCNGVSGPSVVKVKLRFGHASGGGATEPLPFTPSPPS